MRIAIAAMGPDKDGKVCRHGARADCYLVFDETGTMQNVLRNPFKDYDHAVGIRMADYLAENAIDVVAAANLGTGFTRALESKGVRYIECEGAIGDVAKDLAVRIGTS